MVIDYFNGCTPTRSLGIAVQVKIMKKIFVGIFRSMVRYLFLVAFREVQNCIMEGRRI
jgi:hypothetical protein